ncbi:hypothetical protein BC629DRAFT_1440791 [Irpex lacteus]|nr:hypothetical protein BC629DRAFT_1440791 [Irpex lacteus]
MWTGQEEGARLLGISPTAPCKIIGWGHPTTTNLPNYSPSGELGCVYGKQFVSLFVVVVFSRVRVSFNTEFITLESSPSTRPPLPRFPSIVERVDSNLPPLPSSESTVLNIPSSRSVPAITHPLTANTMFANYSPTTTRPTLTPSGEDPFVVYARSLHDYTLHLWTESIRITQEKKQQHAAAKAERAAAQKQRHTGRVSGMEREGGQGFVETRM